MFKNIILTLFASLYCISSVVHAQNEGQASNGKAYETTSPYGVSYHSGSFVYNLPLFTVGSGDYPFSIPISLDYDSSNHVGNVAGWSISGALGAGGMVTESVYDRFDQFDEPSNEPLYEFWKYAASFSVGKFSRTVEITDANLSLKQFHIATLSGDNLDYDVFGGYFSYNMRDGSNIKVKGGIENGRLEYQGDIVLSNANGVRLWNNVILYGSAMNKMGIENSLGLLVVIEDASFTSMISYQKICAYNLAYVDRTETLNCARSDTVATLKWQRSGTLEPHQLLEVTRPDGSVFRFEYETTSAIGGYSGPLSNNDFLPPAKIRRHLTCIRNGAGICLINNVYDSCDGYSGRGFPNQGGEDLGWTGSRDRVIRQYLPDGRSIRYSYPGQTVPCREVMAVETTDASGVVKTELALHDNVPLGVSYLSHMFPKIVSTTDQLSQKTEYKWAGGNPNARYLKRDDILTEVKYPEGNLIRYKYDNRGNLLEQRNIAKQGTGLPDIVQSWVFPDDCSNLTICNKPTSFTDARGNITEYTYDAVHGGVLTETKPAGENGVRPQMRYTYMQRHPWLKAGSGYVRVTSPIWVKTREQFCKLTSAVEGGCSGGAADAVTIDYDYGPDGGPNNLWLRGTVVTATNSAGVLESRRTCYAYDKMGRRISEIKPLAGLTTCP